MKVCSSQSSKGTCTYYMQKSNIDMYLFGACTVQSVWYLRAPRSVLVHAHTSITIAVVVIYRLSPIFSFITKSPVVTLQLNYRKVER